MNYSTEWFEPTDDDFKTIFGMPVLQQRITDWKFKIDLSPIADHCNSTSHLLLTDKTDTQI